MRIEARELVIGVAVGYGEAQVGPFVRSLRATGYDGAILLIVDDATIARLQGSALLDEVQLAHVRPWKLNVKPIFRTRFGWRVLWPPIGTLQWLAIRLAGDAERRRRLAARILHPQLGRFFYYQRLLRDVAVERVLISDVRDVVFQEDPFEHLDGHELAMGLETDAYTVGTEYWNRLWVRAGFGNAMLERIGGERVCCAGVVYGSYEAIVRYVDRMVDAILSWSRQGMVKIGDQGLHNVLLWTGALGRPELLETTGSPLATLNNVSQDQLRVSDDGRLVNENGTTVSIVHQFDRVEGLSERLAALTAPGRAATRSAPRSGGGSAAS